MTHFKGKPQELRRGLRAKYGAVPEAAWGEQEEAEEAEEAEQETETEEEEREEEEEEEETEEEEEEQQEEEGGGDRGQRSSEQRRLEHQQLVRQRSWEQKQLRRRISEQQLHREGSSEQQFRLELEKSQLEEELQELQELQRLRSMQSGEGGSSEEDTQREERKGGEGGGEGEGVQQNRRVEEQEQGQRQRRQQGQQEEEEEEEEENEDGDEENAEEEDEDEVEEEEDEAEELQRLSMQLDQAPLGQEVEHASSAIFKAGWVWKANRTNRGWRKRWLVLDGDSLTYHSQPPPTAAGASGTPAAATTAAAAVTRFRSRGSTPSQQYQSFEQQQQQGQQQGLQLQQRLLRHQKSKHAKRPAKQRQVSLRGQSLCVECGSSSLPSSNEGTHAHLLGRSRSIRVQGRRRVPRGSHIRLTGVNSGANAGVGGVTSGSAKDEEWTFSGFSEAESQEWAIAIENNRRAASSQWGEEACQAMAQIMQNARFGFA
jgi:hypothetical protein